MNYFENALKRSIKEKLYYMPPDNLFTLFLFSYFYPFIMCDDYTYDEIITIIESSLIRLSFQYIKIEDGYIKFKCLNRQTFIWLIENASNLRLRVGDPERRYAMRILPENRFAKTIRLSCILDKPSNDELLPLIFKGNNINTSKCVIHHTEESQDGYKAIIDVNPPCARYIFENNFIINIKKTPANFRIEQNPYSGAFDSGPANYY